MKLGEVYRWKTDKAKSHASREKLHVYICEGDGGDDHIFLFISSANYGDYLIKQTDYPAFLSYDSYVSCGSIVSYNDFEIAQFGPGKPVGLIKKEHLKELLTALQDSFTMEARTANRLSRAILDGLR